MLMRLLLLFTVVPLIELMLLVQMTRHTSLEFTLCLVFVTGFVGAALARHEGLRCWARVQEKLAAGELPGDPLMDGLMILVAGALLVTPGVMTDLVGFALLLPMFRRVIKRRLKGRFEARLHVSTAPKGWPRSAGHPAGHPADQPARRDKIIDVRVIDVPSEDASDQSSPE